MAGRDAAAKSGATPPPVSAADGSAAHVYVGAGLSPRYWVTRAALGLMQLVAPLPYRTQQRLGRALGRALMRLSRRRRLIVRTNLRGCFPNLAPAQLDALVRRNFEATGVSLCELARCWYAPQSLVDIGRVSGMEHLEAALNAGKGAQIVTFHLTGFEIGASVLARLQPLTAVYAPSDDPVFEAHCRRGRLRNAAAIVARHDVRAMLRCLKRNGVLWYTADEGSSLGREIRLPFLGVETGFLPTSSRFTRLTGAPVIPLTQRRLPGEDHVEVTLHAPLEEITGEDEARDTRCVVEFFERHLREHPEDYLWARRRFGVARRDGTHRSGRARRRTLSARRYRKIVGRAEVLERVDGKPRTLLTPEGEVVKLFHRSDRVSLDWVVSPARRHLREMQRRRAQGHALPPLLGHGYCPAYRCFVLRYGAAAREDITVLLDDPGAAGDSPAPAQS